MKRCAFVVVSAVSVGVLDSYVMKLFDRSVDLAQFSADTPLYPVCRAWIHNLSQMSAATEQLQSSESADDDQVEPLIYCYGTLFSTIRN